MTSIAVSLLSNAELFSFSSRIKELILPLDTQGLGIKVYADNFIAKFGVYQQAYEKPPVSAREIMQKDALCDGYFIALNTHLRNFNYHPDAAKRDRATKLLNLLNKEGKPVYKLAMNKQLAALTAAINTIDATALSDIEDLEALTWYGLLKEAHNDFLQTVSRITDNKAESAKIAPASIARKELEEAVRRLFAFIELQYGISQAAELSQLMGQVQAAADRY
jgi:hypothetical protein